ncbi:hypothetical protein RH437_001511 [Salmonella enterica]|uniref:Uncharacterized protein n=1 Tax=Salmonella enterica I TaxID=59201 RepID=A0A5U3ERV8_SALET|nr:hypothetical protein [Salmonella enterica subsp. diarizonae]EBP3998742.1 hypothetical protein [Salmonella enterica subsp. enterica]ELB6470218.1 hypothetical protein [Salmonella enterica]
MDFKFSLGQNAVITVSGEQGHIKGRAHYVHCENAYLLHYRAADGRAVDRWFDESELQSLHADEHQGKVTM